MYSKDFSFRSTYFAYSRNIHHRLLVLLCPHNGDPDLGHHILHLTMIALQEEQTPSSPPRTRETSWTCVTTWVTQLLIRLEQGKTACPPLENVLRNQNPCRNLPEWIQSSLRLHDR